MRKIIIASITLASMLAVSAAQAEANETFTLKLTNPTNMCTAKSPLGILLGALQSRLAIDFDRPQRAARAPEKEWVIVDSTSETAGPAIAVGDINGDEHCTTPSGHIKQAKPFVRKQGGE